MSKVKIITLCTFLALTITLVIIGVIFAIPNETTPPVLSTPTEPTTPLILNVPSGTYYYISGSHTEYQGEIENISAYVYDTLPRFYIGYTGDIKELIPSNNAFIFYAPERITGTIWSEDDRIVFQDGGAEFQRVFNINAEHTDDWHDFYLPKQTREWTCTYDTTNQIIKIVHNSDEVCFKYFENDDAYMQYILEHCSFGEYFSLAIQPNTDITPDLSGPPQTEPPIPDSNHPTE